jgi:hypothetical protein
MPLFRLSACWMNSHFSAWLVPRNRGSLHTSTYACGLPTSFIIASMIGLRTYPSLTGSSARINTFRLTAPFLIAGPAHEAGPLAVARSTSLRSLR